MLFRKINLCVHLIKELFLICRIVLLYEVDVRKMTSNYCCPIFVLYQYIKFYDTNINLSIIWILWKSTF